MATGRTRERSASRRRADRGDHRPRRARARPRDQELALTADPPGRRRSSRCARRPAGSCAVADDLRTTEPPTAEELVGAAGAARADERAPTSSTRCARRSAATAARWRRCAPTTSPRMRAARCWTARRDLDPERDRRRAVRRRQRRPARTTATSPGWRCCSPACRPASPARRSTACAARASTPRCRPAARSRPATPSSCVVGGVESMSRAPWVLLKPERALPAPAHETLYSTTLGWRMVNPRCPSSGRSRSARAPRSWPAIYEISREAQDEFALRSHRLAARRLGRAASTATWVVPVPGTELERDEGIRADTIAREARRAQARVRRRTARSPPGNSSPLNDGAGALLLGRARRRSARPRAARAHRRAAASTAVDPDVFGIAPVEAANQALARAGIGWDDVDVVELNEAFASQSLACLGSGRARPRQASTSDGGAIAIGHPLGASGARILGTLAHELRAPRRRLRRRRHLHRRRAGARRGPAIADAAAPVLAITHWCRNRPGDSAQLDGLGGVGRAQSSSAGATVPRASS